MRVRDNKKRLIDIYSMRFNIWFYFCIFVLLILLSILSIQFFSMRMFYADMKEAELRNVGRQFTEICSSGDYRSILARTRLQSDVNAALFDVNGGVLWETSEFYKSDYLGSYQERIYTSESPVCELVNNDNRYLIVYGFRFNQTVAEGETIDVYCYLTSEVLFNTTTVSVLTKLSVVVSAVAMVVAAVLFALFAKRITKPISKLCEESKLLSRGEYDIKFSSCGYTELDKLATTLTLTAERLSETDALKNELMANVSHDLKTPLTLIRSYAEMIRDISGEDRAKREEHLAVIIDETKRLTVLVNDLLDLSRLNASQEELKLTSFDLSDEVAQTVLLFRSRSEKHFDLNIEEGLFVLADKNMIRRVIANLISNAINYTGSDGYVGVTVARSGAGSVRVDVTDHGEGVAEEEKELIWNRYYRSKMKHTRETEGTGLGLSIVKSILVRHNAEFGVLSKAGKGSDFYFILESDAATKD